MSKKVAFVGDLHFYDGQTKAHKDYYMNCRACMDAYTAEFEATKPDYIFLSGDLIGLSERVMRTRLGLSIFISYLKMWSKICNGNLYSIAGNHDYTKGESMSDFDLLVMLGLVKQAPHVDIAGMRVHLINYGAEREEIELDVSKHNIALMHANLQIDGYTNWFHADEGIALSSLRNLKGVELAICGHIHNPSPRSCSTSIEDQGISLFYLGCATRPKRNDTWSGVYVLYADCDDSGDVALSTNVISLRPASEIHTERVKSGSEEDEDTAEDTEVVDIELLTKILDELSPALMGSEFDYRTQIKRIAGIDEAAANKAIHYIDLADEHAKAVSD